MPERYLRRVALWTAFIYLCLPRAIFAEIIDFENSKGPTTFPSAAQTLSVGTSIGPVIFSGGAILTNVFNLNAASTSVYGTSGNVPGLPTYPGYSNTITITFPQPIFNFSVDLINGDIVNGVSHTHIYQLADNAGHSISINVAAANSAADVKTVGFPARGTVVTITDLGAISSSTSTATARRGSAAGHPFVPLTVAKQERALANGSPRSNASFFWDYFIDNVHFNEGLPPTVPPVPLPPSLIFGVTGLSVLGLYQTSRWLRRHWTAQLSIFRGLL